MGSTPVDQSRWAGEGVVGMYDAIVVGAGIMGSCIAYEFAKRGQSVLLLEQFDFLHRRGSSHGESRIIRMTYPEDYYTAMMTQAYALWEAAHKDAGFSVLTPTGGLDFGPPDNPDFQAVMSSCAKHDVAHEVVTAEDALARFGVRLPAGQLAIYTRDAGVLHATKACAMFQQLAQKHGAVLRDRAEVAAVEAVADSSESGFRVQVRTNKGSATGRHCVVAAGAWTTKLLKGVTSVKLPIQPLHTTVVYWQASEDLLRYSTNGCFPVFINYDEPFVYGMSANEYPGLLKVSLHAGPPCDPDTRSLAPTLDPIHKTLAPWLAARFGSQIETTAPIMAEACMYSMTPDQDYILDSIPLKGSGPIEGKIFVAAGFSGHGFKMGPLVGKIMADLALKGACTDVPMELFSIERFRKSPLGNEKISGPQVRPHKSFDEH